MRVQDKLGMKPLASDFAGARLELDEARRVMGRYEQIMLGYQERPVASFRQPKPTNAEACAWVQAV